MAVILPQSMSVVIAANVLATLDPAAVTWADAVGQANVDPRTSHSRKALPIGQSLRVSRKSLASPPALALHPGAMANPERVPTMFQEALPDGNERTTLSVDVPTMSSDDRVFLSATYRSNGGSASRRRFSCRRQARNRLAFKFASGFARRNSLPGDFEHLRLIERATHREYLRRRQASIFPGYAPGRGPSRWSPLSVGGSWGR